MRGQLSLYFGSGNGSFDHLKSHGQQQQQITAMTDPEKMFVLATVRSVTQYH